MNLDNSQQVETSYSASNTRPVILEVASEVDARGDFTSAFDIRAALRNSCEFHLLRIGSEATPLPFSDNAHQIGGGAPEQLRQLTALFEKIRPDVVHTHRLRDLANIGITARAAGVPRLVHTICDGFPGASEQKVAEFLALAHSLRPMLVAPTAEAACRLNPDTQVTVIPRGIDLSRNRPGDALQARRKIGLPLAPQIVGSASPAASLETLVRSLFRLDSNVHLALFGAAIPGPGERELIRHLGVEERIHVLGSWAQPELIHQAIDVYFHGPSSDNCPRPLLAAQAAAKPAIAIFPAVVDFLCPETGQLLPNQFQPAILSALKRALDNAPAPQARKFVEKNWDAATAMAAYEELFFSMTSKVQVGPAV